MAPRTIVRRSTRSTTLTTDTAAPIAAPEDAPEGAAPTSAESPVKVFNRRRSPRVEVPTGLPAEWRWSALTDEERAALDPLGDDPMEDFTIDPGEEDAAQVTAAPIAVSGGRDGTTDPAANADPENERGAETETGSFFAPMTPLRETPFRHTRERKPGTIRPKSYGRIRPVETLTLADLRVLQLVARFGALPVGIAAALAEVVDGKARCYTYWAAQKLEGMQYLARLPLTALPMRRARGLGLVLVAGPRLGEWASSVGLPADPPFTSTGPMKAMVEQIALTGEVIRRVARGDQLVVGDAWLRTVAERGQPGWSNEQRSTVQRALAGRAWRFPEDAQPAGLIPADPSSPPALVLGGTWGRVSRLRAFLKLTQLIDPIEVVVWRRSGDFLADVRSAVMGRASRRRRQPRDPSRPFVTAIPSGRGLRWQKHWEAVEQGFHSSDPGRLAARLRALVDGEGDPA